MRDCRGTRFRIFSNRTIGNEVVDPKLDEERPSQVGNLAAEDACGSPDGRWIMGTKRKGREVFCYDARAKVFVAIGDAKISTGFIPLHYVHARHAFLLARFSVCPLSPEIPPCPEEYRLLDPTTGRSVPLAVASEPEPGCWWLQPWSQRLPRRLQQVNGEPNVAWAAVPTSKPAGSRSAGMTPRRSAGSVGNRFCSSRCTRRTFGLTRTSERYMPCVMGTFWLSIWMTGCTSKEPRRNKFVKFVICEDGWCSSSRRGIRGGSI